MNEIKNLDDFKKLADILSGDFEMSDESINKVLRSISRAPISMRKMGLEWLWRLIKQPKRLGRIFRAVIIFPLLVLKEKIGYI